MTRDEITKLLEFTCAAYPNAKITDPAGTASVWEMAFGDYPAERIFKAVRFHIQTNRFFPTIADIQKNITRAEIAYNASESLQNRLEGNKSQISLPAKRSITESEYEAILEWVEAGCPFDNDY